MDELQDNHLLLALRGIGAVDIGDDIIGGIQAAICRIHQIRQDLKPDIGIDLLDDIN